MAMEKKSSKIITAVLAIIIIVAVITIVYISLPKNENETENNNGGEQENVVVLQMLYNDTYKNFTLNQLEDLDSMTGTGGYIKSNNMTSGPYELTGVRISTLLNEFENLPDNFSINIEALDSPTNIFNKSIINGNVAIFNETGVQIGTGGAEMIIIYKQNGVYLNNSDGPLRTGFIYEGGFTSSKLWIKQVLSMLIIYD